MRAAATITQRDKLPDEARMGAGLIERYGFSWELDLRYPTPDARARRVQVREEKHCAPRAEVAKYSAALARNEKLPPIVVTRDGYVIDGNTRAEAAKKNKYPTTPALVLDVSYDDADESLKDQLQSLGSSFNIRNGRGIDRDETRRSVVAMGRDSNFDASRIADLLGIQPALAISILAEERAITRAKALGITPKGIIPAGQLRRLGQAKINDKPFIELWGLTEDAGLSANEVGEVIKKIYASGSDEKAVETIVAERANRRDQIREFRVYGKPTKPSKSALLRQKLGFVVKHEAAPTDLVEHNPTLTEGHLSVLERAIATLVAARDAQRKAA